MEGQYHYYLPSCFECLNETSWSLSQYVIADFQNLKKKLDGKILKRLMKNFKIWLLPLKETFVDALNTSDIHSSSLNFVSSKRRWFFQNRKIHPPPKEKIFPFGNNCSKEFLVIFAQLFRTSSYNVIVKNIFVTNFSFLIADSLKTIYSL